MKKVEVKDLKEMCIRDRSDVVTLYILEMEYKLCPFSMVCKK